MSVSTHSSDVDDNTGDDSGEGSKGNVTDEDPGPYDDDGDGDEDNDDDGKDDDGGDDDDGDDDEEPPPPPAAPSGEGGSAGAGDSGKGDEKPGPTPEELAASKTTEANERADAERDAAQARETRAASAQQGPLPPAAQVLDPSAQGGVIAAIASFLGIESGSPISALLTGAADFLGGPTGSQTRQSRASDAASFMAGVGDFLQHGGYDANPSGLSATTYEVGSRSGAIYGMQEGLPDNGALFDSTGLMSQGMKDLSERSAAKEDAAQQNDTTYQDADAEIRDEVYLDADAELNDDLYNERDDSPSEGAPQPAGDNATNAADGSVGLVLSGKESWQTAGDLRRFRNAVPGALPAGGAPATSATDDPTAPDASSANTEWPSDDGVPTITESTLAGNRPFSTGDTEDLIDWASQNIPRTSFGEYGADGLMSLHVSSTNTASPGIGAQLTSDDFYRSFSGPSPNWTPPQGTGAIPGSPFSGVTASADGIIPRDSTASTSSGGGGAGGASGVGTFTQSNQQGAGGAPRPTAPVGGAPQGLIMIPGGNEDLSGSEGSTPTGLGPHIPTADERAAMTAIQLGALSAGAAFSAGGLAASEAVEATLPRIAGFLKPFFRSPPVRLSMGLLTVKQFAEIRGPNDPRVVGAVLGFGATAGELDAAARAGLPIARDVFGVLGNSARSSAFMFMGAGSIGGGGYIPLPSAGAAVEGAAETGVAATELEGVESVPQTGYVPMPAEGSLESVGVGDAAEGGGTLKFGETDLVYGPSADGALRDLADTAGGRTLTDLEKPVEMNWEDFSIRVMEEQSRAVV